ncbi:MAG: sugar phosphate isomerase/epimerase [Clostridia bacterium]
MNVSFHTNAFAWAGETDIEKVADFAVKAGFGAIEVGPMFAQDFEKFKNVQKKVAISAFIYCRNFIDDNEENAKREVAILKSKMLFAHSLGVKKIITSTGISSKLSMGQSGCDPLASIDKVVEFLNEILELAEKLDLYICLENCPMYRNIATSPLMWREIFARIKSERLGICYDPAHFVWQMIDVYRPLSEFKDKIYHLHLKDTEIFREKLDDVGILHNTAKERGFEKNQWWRHTILGDGEIDWNKFLSLVDLLPRKDLLDMSFEMEDYKYECVVENVEKAYEIQLQRLQNIDFNSKKLLKIN